MKNNTSLPLNLNSFKLLIHKPPLQPSLLPMNIEEEESNKFTISDTTTTAKHCNNADDTIYSISGITCFSLLISNTFLFNVISTCEANETSSSEKIPLYTFSIITYIPSISYIKAFISKSFLPNNLFHVDESYSRRFLQPNPGAWGEHLTSQLPWSAVSLLATHVYPVYLVVDVAVLACYGPA